MLKKILIGVVLLLVVAVGALTFWAKSILASDTVRNALAAQVSEAVGQPVTVGSISATIYPRVTVTLGDVSIGQPAKIQVKSLDVGTDFGALLSRRIEKATLTFEGARIELPLPPFAFAEAAPSSDPSASAVEVVSIDAIVLNGVEIVSGGRTLKGDIEVAPHGRSVEVRKVALAAEDTTLDITGTITDLNGPTGELTVKAGALDFDRLLAFANAFSSGSGLASTTTTTTTTPAAAGTSGQPAVSELNLLVTLNATRASMGGLTIEPLSGKARVTRKGLALDPVSFGVFGGTYTGTLDLSLDETPAFTLAASLAGVDVAAATAFAGVPGQVTGRLGGTINLSGRGMDAPSVIKTARGTLRADITDGVVKNLGLVQTVVLATSMRADATSQMSNGSKDEPFSRLGLSLDIADGTARTSDLRFEGKDLSLDAAGSLRLDGSDIDLKGQVQLSEALSQQAGRDLMRYTQKEGKVTLPATVSGPATAPAVRIDVGNVVKTAITKKAREEGQKAIKKGLGGLFRR